MMEIKSNFNFYWLQLVRVAYNKYSLHSLSLILFEIIDVLEIQDSISNFYLVIPLLV